MDLRSTTGACVALALACAAPLACKTSKSSQGAAPITSESSRASALPVTPPAPPVPEDKFPLEQSAIDAIVNPSHATEYTGDTGVIEGTVKVSGDPARVRKFIPLPKECEAAVANHAPEYRAGAGGELADALVAVIMTSGFVRPSRADKLVTLKSCSILPTLIDLSIGQRLLVANEDTTPYTPTLPTRQTITRLAIRGQSAVPLFLVAPGAYGMTWLPGMAPGADVPTATVFVLPNALHMATDLTGKYRIAGIPVGKAKLVVSHVGMPEFGKEIEIKAGEVLKLDVPMTYKLPAAPTASAAPAPTIR
jgi:hypothetical protein